LVNGFGWELGDGVGIDADRNFFSGGVEPWAGDYITGNLVLLDLFIRSLIEMAKENDLSDVPHFVEVSTRRLGNRIWGW
jgi:hypothetical protein